MVDSYQKFLTDEEGYQWAPPRKFFESIPEKFRGNMVDAVQKFFEASPYFARIKIGEKTYLLGHAAAITERKEAIEECKIKEWRDYIDFRLDNPDKEGFESSLYNAVGKGLSLEDEKKAKELALKGFIGNRPLLGISCFITGHMHFSGMADEKKARYGLVPVDDARVIGVAHDSLITIDSFYDTVGYLDISLGSSGVSGGTSPVTSLRDKEGMPAFKSMTARSSPVNEIPCDAEFSTILLTDLLHAQLHEDRIYEIKYDASRLTPSQAEIIEEYKRLLQARCSNPGNIRLNPFSSAQGSNESLIAVYCTSKDFKGEGHVDVNMPGGELKAYLLRITGMINIALAASNIPDDLSREDVDKYRPLMSYINNQYKAILGEALVIPDSPEDILNVIRRIVLGLPKFMMANLGQIEEYNRLAKLALTAA